jgi:hypothetical protein
MWFEQTENPRVGSSNLSLGTKYFKDLAGVATSTKTALVTCWSQRNSPAHQRRAVPKVSVMVPIAPVKENRAIG